MKITEAAFLQSAQGISDSPSPNRAEVAFWEDQMLENLLC